jgi:uncharacterized metal-binding protein
MAMEALIEFLKSGTGSAIGLITAASFSIIGIILLILGIIFLFAVLAVIIGGLILWVWMLVDCLQRKFSNKNEKIVWIIILIASIFGAIFLLHLLAAIVYNFVVRNKKVTIKLNRKGK